MAKASKLIKDKNFEKLYITKKLKVKHFCLRYFRGYKHQAENIEDVVHEVFINYYKHSDSFRGDSSVDTFLLSIARNYCLNFIRHQRCLKRSAIEISLNSEKNSPEFFAGSATGRRYSDPQLHPGDIKNTYSAGSSSLDEIISKESIETIHLAMNKLPERDRLVINRVCEQGMSYAEAAKDLNVVTNTVRSRLSRARNRLKKRLSRGS